MDGVTAEVLGQSVFVYTHTGELRRLPKVRLLLLASAALLLASAAAFAHVLTAGL